MYRSPTPELLSEDMRRDRDRRRWEREAEGELEQDEPVGPVHYQELRAQEVRSHGAGYYAFSVDEEQRKKQIGLLNKLREQVAKINCVVYCKLPKFNSYSVCLDFCRMWSLIISIMHL